MRWSTSFPVQSCEGMPQVMPAEIVNLGSYQRIAPCLGVDLHNWIALVGEYMGWVIALPTFQHLQCSLAQRNGVRSAVFVVGCRHPQMATLQFGTFLLTVVLTPPKAQTEHA